MVEKKKTVAKDGVLSIHDAITTPANPLMIVYEDYLNTKCKGMSPYQKKVFIAQATMNKLDPIKGEIYGVPFRNADTNGMDFVPVIDYKVYISKAIATGMLNGYNAEAIKNEKGEITGGKIIIHRKDREYPFTYDVSFQEIAKKKKDGGLTKQRADNPEFMTKKTLIKQGFSMCFPSLLKGNNMDQPETEISESEVIVSDAIDHSTATISRLLQFLPQDKMEDLKKFSEGKSDKEIVEALKTTLLAISTEIGLSDENYEKIKNI